MTPTPTVHDFDFGLIGGPLELPTEEPAPSSWLVYTAWHINRALGLIKLGPASYTVPRILSAFKVIAPAPPS